MEYQEHVCSNGAKVRIATEHNDVAQAAFAFYDKWRGHLCFVCPFCENDDAWDSLDGERDGNQFYDTYSCKACNTLITLITPHGREYHDIMTSETTYEIDFMMSGEPSTWPDRDQISPDQLELL